jgi:hypothetical protein
LGPDELNKSGLPELLDGIIVSTGCPTNAQSGNELDYFIIYRSLFTSGAHADIEVAGSFSPHMAVRLTLDLPRDPGLARRLQQPRVLPIEKIIGPNPTPQYEIEWNS